jgi:predicted DNA-binding transcriptional regulator AlpA
MLQELLQQPNITISITSEQLLQFANQLLNGAREIYEKAEEPEQYITRKQVAKMLDVDLSTLWRWDTQLDYLHPIDIGGKRKYKLSDINKILRGQH